MIATSSFYWVSDPGHGWLVVPAETVREVVAGAPGNSGVAISEFSSISPDGTLAFLEEDCDAPNFLAAAGVDWEKASRWRDDHRDSDHPCRRFPSFA